MLQREPSRGNGGVPKRSRDLPPRSVVLGYGQIAARRVTLPGCGRVSKINEDVRKYAAERAISEEEPLKKGMEEKATEFVKKGSEMYSPLG